MYGVYMLTFAIISLQPNIGGRLEGASDVSPGKPILFSNFAGFLFLYPSLKDDFFLILPIGYVSKSDTLQCFGGGGSLWRR